MIKALAFGKKGLRGSSIVARFIKRIQEEKIMPVKFYNIEDEEAQPLIKKWLLYGFPLIVIIDDDYKRSKKHPGQWIDKRRDIIRADDIKKYPEYIWEKIKKMANKDFEWEDLQQKYLTGGRKC